SHLYTHVLACNTQPLVILSSVYVSERGRDGERERERVRERESEREREREKREEGERERREVTFDHPCRQQWLSESSDS
ncbi:MAG: hypothetical protein MJE68_05520, partial [Proteobacteria bacterium]|nr:hypothetical protein [Pseudomonadota bacterium]